jgi:DNA polymerase-1
VVAAYEKAGLTEEDAIVQARVARILRYEEFNQKKEEVLLWNP